MQKNLFYNYIVDYKDRSGNDLHNIFQIPTFAIKGEQDGAMAVKGFLLANGYTVKHLYSPFPYPVVILYYIVPDISICIVQQTCTRYIVQYAY